MGKSLGIHTMKEGWHYFVSCNPKRRKDSPYPIEFSPIVSELSIQRKGSTGMYVFLQGRPYGLPSLAVSVMLFSVQGRILPSAEKKPKQTSQFLLDGLYTNSDWMIIAVSCSLTWLWIGEPASDFWMWHWKKKARWSLTKDIQMFEEIQPASCTSKSFEVHASAITCNISY